MTPRLPSHPVVLRVVRRGWRSGDLAKARVDLRDRHDAAALAPDGCWWRNRRRSRMHLPRHYAVARPTESRDDIASRIALADLTADPPADPQSWWQMAAGVTKNRSRGAVLNRARPARTHILDLARLKAEG